MRTEPAAHSRGGSDYRRFMTELDIVVRASAALIAGGLIGLERSYRGRAAGLRTNALVALGAALIVAVAQHAGAWAKLGEGDPTRVIQGIVTGIGFLGGGVIIKDGFSVRGLTTAAAVWVVAAIGVVFGAGLFAAGTAATFIAWCALELLRQLEGRMPVHAQVHCQVAFRREKAFGQERMRELVESRGFRITELSYHLDGERQLLEYEIVMWSGQSGAPTLLERALLGEPDVNSFRITPTRD